MTQTLQRVRAAGVNSGRRRREVKVVSAEENGKSKTYKTYRNLDLEYNLKKGRKEQTEKLRTLVSLSFHFHASLTKSCLVLLVSSSKKISYSHFRVLQKYYHIINK